MNQKLVPHLVTNMGDISLQISLLSLGAENASTPNNLAEYCSEIKKLSQKLHRYAVAIELSTKGVTIK